MRTGEPTETTGTYRSACGCRVEMTIPRGPPAPVCPVCMRRVVWTLRPEPPENGAEKPPPRPGQGRPQR
jgi:hypothetical protein